MTEKVNNHDDGATKGTLEGNARLGSPHSPAEWIVQTMGAINSLRPFRDQHTHMTLKGSEASGCVCVYGLFVHGNACKCAAIIIIHFSHWLSIEEKEKTGQPITAHLIELCTRSMDTGSIVQVRVCVSNMRPCHVMMMMSRGAVGMVSAGFSAKILCACISLATFCSGAKNWPHERGLALSHTKSNCLPFHLTQFGRRTGALWRRFGPCQLTREKKRKGLWMPVNGTNWCVMRGLENEAHTVKTDRGPKGGLYFVWKC